MIIFYGTREARLSTKVFEDRFCPYCGQKGTVTCTVFSKHAHVFWIPLLPVGKREVIWCTHCGHEFKHAGETGPDLQKRIAAFSYRQKVPFWQWTGLLLLIAFIANTLIFGYLGARRETKNTELFIESPQVGDVYCVKYEKVYTLMAIDSIENDSVFFIENKYTMSFKSEAIQLHRDAFYDHDYIYGYTHDELKEMFHEDKSILNIWRNLPYQTKKLDLTDEERKLLEEDGDNEEEDEYDAFMEKMYEDNEVRMEELRNLGEKTFENAELNECIAKYRELYRRFEESVARNDADSVAACEEDYEVWYTETAEVVGKLSMEEIKEFVPYSAKLSLQWYDLRVKYGEE